MVQPECESLIIKDTHDLAEIRRKLLSRRNFYKRKLQNQSTRFHVRERAQDRVAAFRNEVEQAIDQASRRINDASEWWDEYYAHPNGKTIGEGLLDQIEAVAVRYAKDFT